VRIKKVNAKLPCALTIAGSDSGGGAGIQADLKTFAAIGVHGTSAITCITAQNPLEVRGVMPISPGMVTQQIAAVAEVLKPEAIKTGMLYSAEIISAVEEALPAGIPVIIDPVMISTSGALLLRDSAVKTLKKFLRRARLVTPNLHETEYLLSRELTEPDDLRVAAREFHERYGCAALIKGGHLAGMNVALDFLYDGKDEWMLQAPYVQGVSTHGTGCTYSAAITAYLALGETLANAVLKAKEFISNAIAQSYKTSGHFVLNTHWNRT
jgi:hydroxymethylpyrimidine/phosphomethylpyrimidine kinase